MRQRKWITNDMEGWQALHHKVTASLDELRDHEAAENALLQQAFNVDVGLTD